MDNIPNNKFYTTAVSCIRNIAVTNAKLQMISEENENSSTISLMCKMPCCRIDNKICSYQELIMMYYQAIGYDCPDILAHLNEVSHTLFVDALALDAKYNELFRRENVSALSKVERKNRHATNGIYGVNFSENGIIELCGDGASATSQYMDLLHDVLRVKYGFASDDNFTEALGSHLTSTNANQLKKAKDVI